MWVSQQLSLHNFHFHALLLSILLASTQCSESLRYHGVRAADLQPLHSPRDAQYSSNYVQGDAQVLALGNHGTAEAEERRQATPARDLKVASRSTRNSNDKEVRANPNGTRVPDIEVKALAAFNAAISGDPLDALKSWNVRSANNDSDVCSSWAGVTCSPQYPYHVVALILPDLQLAGNLNSAMLEFAQLSFLQRLDLSHNIFTGSIEGGSLTNFSHLSYFNVSHNFLSGEIPSEIGELVSLQDLDVNTNNLSGLIPSLANCSFLRIINVGTNFLDGYIPPWLGTLSRLESLHLDTNSLSGNIPSELGNCSSLRDLDFSDNYLLGSVLPQELYQLQLQQLRASECSYGGPVPMWIGNLTTLEVLDLSTNRFEGEIPHTIGQLKLLKKLFLYQNLLTGVLPSSVFNCTSLINLELEGNQFTGHIPQEVGLLTKLEVLDLVLSNFTGVIPSSLDNCSALYFLELGLSPMDPEPFPSWIGSHTNLQTIYLDLTSLQGEIPDFIGNLSSLQGLYLGWNNLSGSIPTSLKNCVLLELLELQGNDLTGNIPLELGVLSHMSAFYAGENHLTGSFPAAFLVNWTQLNLLDVGQNLLSGMVEIPATVGNLNQLSYLGASENDFVGSIPETLGNSSSLTQLEFSSNRFSGEIPSSLQNMTSLQQLLLGDNQLQGRIPLDLLRLGRQFGRLDLSVNLLNGSIPFDIGENCGLTNLDLSYNNFSGIVPSSLGNCSSMNQLDLSHNHFEGNIPTSAIAAMLGSLISLNLSYNFFSGIWPGEFRELQSIEFINVSANNLSGSIPLGLGECFSLQSLDLSMNRFTGEIPQDLGLLSELEFFNASFNEFEGPIPKMGLFNSNRINGESFLGNPALCGPANIIGRNYHECAVPARSVSGQESCGGFKCTKVWVPVTAAAIISISLLVVFLITGINLGWILSTGSRKIDDDKEVIINFANHVRFTESDVLQTVNDPRKNNIIGGGTTSIVYKGVQPGGVQFAVKKLLPTVDPTFKELRDGVSNHPESDAANEAEALANCRHRNILKCLAFYSKSGLEALISEYLSEGSLHEHLHEGPQCTLTWETRLKIAMGVAQGLLYLHHDFPEPIIHRDLKPRNILLDADFEPKIGDFGISKFVNPLRDGQATASRVFGTIGYMAPEYSSIPFVSTKGDVYSYGMVVLELLTRREPSSMADLGDDGQDLRTRVLNHFNDKPFELLDPYLLKECILDNKAMEQIMLLFRVSLFCTRLVPQSRPPMINVVGMLTYIVNFELKPANNRTVEDVANDMDPKIWSSEDLVSSSG